MKKFWKTLCILSAAAFTLTNCEDVPAPYQAPGTAETGNENYISESFLNDLGDFVSQSASGTLEWGIDYQSACVTGFQDFDGDGQKENQAGVTYLVSPAIDLSGSTGAYITFDHAINYERGDIAANNALLISKDYTGDPATATWEQLPVNTEGTNSDFTFVNAGKITIPEEYIGVNPVYVALRHTCTDASSSTWEVRNFKVVEGTGEEIENPDDEAATIFSEPFDSSLGAFTIDNVKPAEGLGSEVWTYDSKYVCAKATSYTGGEGGSNIPAESWLVSPVIDLKEASAATLTFDHAANYFNDVKTDVTVWITDAAAENWTQLDVPTYPTSFTFVSSGDIDLNAYKGKEVKIAFKYVCTTKAGTYEVKNFLVQERQAEEAPEVPDTDEALSVAQAIAQYDAGQAQPGIRVKGYIVGYVEGMNMDGATFGASGDAVSNTNLMIADRADETDVEKCLVIQLPSGDVRSALNLKDHPENLGKEVTLLGSLEKYFGTYGLKSVSEYTLDGEGGGTEEPDTPGDSYLNVDFGSTMGGFTIEDVVLPEGLDYVWKQDAQFSQMKASAYVSGTNYATESWLISPVVDLTSASSATLTFIHIGNFFDNMEKEATLWARTEGGEWQSLIIPNYPDGNNWDSVESGDIDLSAYCGQKIQIGFKYTSSSSAAGTWEIQDVVIK